MLQETVTAVSLCKSALDLLKQVKDLIPNDKSKESTTNKIEQLEIQLKETQAITAKKLGYEICHCTFPPHIMLKNKEGLWECQSCNCTLNPLGIG